MNNVIHIFLATQSGHNTIFSSDCPCLILSPWIDFSSSMTNSVKPTIDQQDTLDWQTRGGGEHLLWSSNNHKLHSLLQGRSNGMKQLEITRCFSL